MIYILGDLHTRQEEPFFTAVSGILDRFKILLKPKDHLIQLGDLFHRSKPTPKEYSLIFSFVQWCLVNDVLFSVMNGNHDYNAYQDTFSTDPLQEFINIYNTPLANFSVGDTLFVFLPWLSPRQVKQITNESLSLKQFYEEFLPSQENTSTLLNLFKQVIFMYHFPDETIAFGEQVGINLSVYNKLHSNLIRVGGDIHKPVRNYLGTPYQTRYDEKGNKSSYYQFDEKNESLKRIFLPTFLEFIDVDFNEPFNPSTDPDTTILTVFNAPNMNAAQEKFSNYHIRAVESESSIDRVIKDSEEGTESNIKKLFSEFVTINKLDKTTTDYIREVFT